MVDKLDGLGLPLAGLSTDGVLVGLKRFDGIRVGNSSSSKFKAGAGVVVVLVVVMMGCVNLELIKSNVDGESLEGSLTRADDSGGGGGGDCLFRGLNVARKGAQTSEDELLLLLDVDVGSVSEDLKRLD